MDSRPTSNGTAIDMSQFNVTVDDRELKAFIKNAGPDLVRKLDVAVNRTTASGLRVIKTALPSRSGSVRQSYKQRRIGSMTREIYSEYIPAIVLDQGTEKAYTVRPRRAKMLTIPIDESVKTRGGQIKKGALDRLFRMLKGRKKGVSKKQIFDSAKIVLAKEARIPKKTGKHHVERILVPFLESDLNRNVQAAVDEVIR
jgi:hypothetical protein